jgi:putative tryptophan/tyrosine transport system substrate-binding protein
MAEEAARKREIPLVGILTPAESEHTVAFEAFRQGLRDLGYTEGKSIVLDFRCSRGHNDELPRLARKLLEVVGLDVIVADTTMAARAVWDLNRQIPIVQAVGDDPVTLGMAKSHHHPDGNVTGFYICPVEASAERLKKLKESTEKAKKALNQVTILLDETNVITPAMFYATWKVAYDLKIKLRTLVANIPDDLKKQTDKKDALADSDGFMVFPGAMFWNNRADVVKLPTFNNVPAIYPEKEYGNLYHGYDIPEAFNRAAIYVDRILRGARPGELAIQEAKLDSNC